MIKDLYNTELNTSSNFSQTNLFNKAFNQMKYLMFTETINVKPLFKVYFNHKYRITILKTLEK